MLGKIYKRLLIFSKMNFIKKIFEGKSDESVHMQFTRFGKGEYPGRFLLGLKKSKKVKLKSSFEFANDFVKIASGFGAAKVSGVIMSKQDISGILSKNNIQGNSEEKKGGLYYINNIPSQELNSSQIIELENASYFALLDLEGKDFSVKIKKKLPKPGKSEGKIDDKFCQLEADEKYYSKLKEDLFWDVSDAKKISAKHTVVITEIVMPKDEKDYAKIRELAKRKGKIIRKIEIDEKEITSEKSFEA